ncbi:Metal-dependent hydrolase, endonuclease/exonuclease/phosphatase family [Maribacter orientalis]|uniref:Metal-dependent hydrolase, endonuclease/exonuclease/phosphatase family n=1 Tax=Maribacter orientalis TaxID=228957 RepID=A0A1H7GBF1_9FLAO|nr:endonuclease/exonuclease/phosphatase family protein [Maribacter orientalis]SEK34777.1 Metal-dependent hydrolase, endonuclease/exonuclease/phosphatase family [Maribacter orientalis]
MRFLKLIGIVLVILMANKGFSQDISVMTYNIKWDNTNDTVNNWNDRKEAMVDLLKHYQPNIIGMQEVVNGQLNYLVTNLPNFSSIGVGREDGKEKGEYSPILYDTKLLKVVKSSTFWLSDTPDKISVGWDAALERICTYALFEDLKTKKQFWVFNTHFDHIGVMAREKSAELIVSKMKDINVDNLPVVLMGDLNLTPDETPILYLKDALTDGQSITVKKFYGPTGTFNGFDQDRVLTNRIDYIFVDSFKVLEYMHIDDRMENNKHISDHLPVLTTISF